MSAVPRSLVCERVRGQVSLRLDGELSQLESRMVDAHLARCSDCREFELTVCAITEDLRTAPLEPVSRPVVVRRLRRAAPLARTQIGIAAALAVVVLGGVTQLGTQRQEVGFGTPQRFDTSAQLEREVKQIIRNGRAFSRHGAAIPI